MVSEVTEEKTECQVLKEVTGIITVIKHAQLSIPDLWIHSVPSSRHTKQRMGNSSTIIPPLGIRAPCPVFTETAIHTLMTGRDKEDTFQVLCQRRNIVSVQHQSYHNGWRMRQISTDASDPSPLFQRSAPPDEFLGFWNWEIRCEFVKYWHTL